MMFIKAPVLILFSVSLTYSLPLCEVFQRDSFIPGDARIPDFYNIDVSLNVPVPPQPCTLDMTGSLMGFIKSSTPHLQLRISCYSMEIEILPIRGDIEGYLKTLSITMIKCNTSYSDIIGLAPEKLIELNVLMSNISDGDSDNRTYPCRGVTNLLRIYLDRCCIDSVWTRLVSCENVLSNVYWLFIKNTDFNLIQDIKKFRRLQYLALSNVGLDAFPESHLSYAELESNETFPAVYRHFAPFSKTFDDFDTVVMRLLDFSYNNITDLPTPLTLKYIPIHYLKLNNNKIRYLSPYIFSTIRHLVEVDFSFNLIDDIPENIFWGLNFTLQNIHFQSNLLTSLPRLLFSGLILLDHVNFADNRLTTLDPHLFSVNNRYIIPVSINFGNNKLRNISGELFSNVRFAAVNFRNNSLRAIPEELLILGDLQHADFSYNPVNGIALSQLALSALNYGQRRDVIPHVIDLSYCNVSTIPDGKNFSIIDIASYQIFFSTYQVLLHNNPINCTCDMRIFVIDLLTGIGFPLTNKSGERKTIIVDDNFFDSWKCQVPEEYSGLEVTKLPSSDFYCRVMSSTCPDQCECFWYENDKLLVDCSNSNYTDIPDYVQIQDFSTPNNFRIHTSNAEEINADISNSKNNTYIHMKVSNADLVRLSYREYISKVKTLDVSFNGITSLSADIIQAFKDRVNFTLDISNNRISYLPQDITTLQLKEIRLGNNPYVCDCNSLWLKHWIQDRRVPVLDWKDITCLDINKHGRTIVDVPDEEFVCPEKFNTVIKIVLPAIGVGTGIFCLIIFCMLLHLYRHELKVLMFIYFGFHPFDKDERRYPKNEFIDVFMAHGPEGNLCHLEEVRRYLQERGLSVAMLSQDQSLGYTRHENLRHLIEHSKRLIIYLRTSADMKHDWFTTAWSLANEKIKRTKANYAVVLHAGKGKVVFKDRELKRYVNNGRLIQISELIALKKLLYLMPKPRLCKTTSPCSLETPESKTASTVQVTVDTVPDNLNEPSKIRWSVFVSYDSDDFLYVRRKLMPLLEQRGLILNIPDRDFDVGVPIETNFITAIDGSRHTLFILSNKGFADEWRRFAFNLAREKSVAEKSNHLIVIMIGDVSVACLSDDLRNYVETYTCIGTEDPLFVHVLLNTLIGRQFKDGLAQ